MPAKEEKEVVKRARRAKAQGKAPSTQAGEFVREEIEHIREGKHGARSAKQAIAIGLSKARRAGVDLLPPEPGKASEETRQSAKRAYARGHGAAAARRTPPAKRRSRAVHAALEREGKEAASPRALSKQAKSSAARRTPSERSAAARKAVRTKGPARRAAAAKKAARTRARSTTTTGKKRASSSSSSRAPRRTHAS